MSNIYLKATIKKRSQYFNFVSKKKKIVPRSVLGEFQLTQILLNCYLELKIIGLGAKVCMAFLYF